MRAAAHLPCRILRRLDARLGRRGSYLAVAGSAWTLYGLGIILDPRVGTVKGVSILRHLLPIEAWGAFWMLCGLTAVAFAFTRDRDRFGFFAAVLPAAVWSGAYAAALMTGDFPKAWTSMATWALAAIRLIIVSGWVEPARRPRKLQESA